MSRSLPGVLQPLVLSAVAFSFFISPMARAQESETEVEANSALVAPTKLQNIFAGSEASLSMKMNQLNGSWSRFSAMAAKGNPEVEVWGAMMGLEFDVYFTRGQIEEIGGDTFLVAYRLPLNIDRRFLNWHGHGPAPRPRKPDSETVLNLSLLNLRNINGLKDVRPFNAQTDMESVSQINAASVRTLTTLGNGMMRFLRARGKFPVLANPITWNAKRAFYPYVGDERLFMHPSTQQMYRWNENLNGKKAAHFKNKQSTVVFYEAENSGDGTRGVLFMDGHVERLQLAHWERVKKASKIIEGRNAGMETVAVVGAPTTTVVVRD